MSQPDFMQELQTLWSAAECGELSDSQRARLNELVVNDDAALASLMEQLEVDALLRWHHGGVEPDPPAKSVPQRIVRPWYRTRTALGGFATAACLLIVVGLNYRSSPPTDRFRNASMASHDAADTGVSASPPSLPTAPESLENSVDSWRVETIGDAEFVRIDQKHIRVVRGPIRIESQIELTIDTPAGIATLSPGACEVRVDISDPDNTARVRVDVIRGNVAFVNAHGTAAAATNQSIQATAMDAPTLVSER